MAPTILHLRHEDKPLEHRSALTPTTAKALINAGYVVNVEKSPARIFDDEEFASIGCSLVPTGSWREAPADHIIVGLKELPEEESASRYAEPHTEYTAKDGQLANQLHLA
ncbi:hypothetical protein O1611_g7836 [Lasiodiplodia mahajangana]|uniref:Uncharacterized protein n=1 Tax=Lasiodiplodia mahajangana TaxID=1108764 RepID=A0ACC2JEC9_9PEZI|nr:hypothetical protein O1611_g7836 [Lasiodiplodia mahajangana]